MTKTTLIPRDLVCLASFKGNIDNTSLQGFDKKKRICLG